MFCIKCGTHFSDGSNYCSKCGEPAAAESNNQTESPPPLSAQRLQSNHDRSQDSRVYQATRNPVARSSYTQAWANDISFQEGNSHPYQILGGWLMYMVYAPLVGIGLMAIAYLYSLFTIIPYIQYIQYLRPLIIISLLIELVGYGVGCFLCVKYSLMLKNKNPNFLRFYELAMIVFCSMYVIVIAVSGFNLAYLSISNSIIMIFSSALGALFATLYFRKSIRVRIYFGNDAYLKYSIFSRNAAAPTSSEIMQYASSLMQYASSQIDTEQQPISKNAKRPKSGYYSAGKKTYERQK
jgi:hypothetical protein